MKKRQFTNQLLFLFNILLILITTHLFLSIVSDYILGAVGLFIFIFQIRKIPENKITSIILFISLIIIFGLLFLLFMFDDNCFEIIRPQNGDVIKSSSLILSGIGIPPEDRKTIKIFIKKEGEKTIQQEGKLRSYTDNRWEFQYIRFPEKGKFDLWATANIGNTEINSNIISVTYRKEENKNRFYPITILTKPNDVQIYINGKYEGKERTFYLPPGEYKILVRKEGYREIQDIVKIPEVSILPLELQK